MAPAIQTFSPAAARPCFSVPSSVPRPHRLGFQCIVRNAVVAASSSCSPYFNFHSSIDFSQKRAGVITHATNEEVQAEKALVEGTAREKMNGAIEALRQSFNTVRTGRSNPSMLDRIEVEYYGVPTSLKNLAQISTPDASSILIQPYDKSILKEIEKAIVKSNLGITPANDGQVIRLTIPPLTSDRRKELLKVVGKLTEEGKVSIRNVRKNSIKAYDKLEKEKKFSKDDVRDLTNDLQKLTDEYIKKVETLHKEKEKDILTV